MSTRRLTVAQALVQFLANQYTERDGVVLPHLAWLARRTFEDIAVPTAEISGMSDAAASSTSAVRLRASPAKTSGG